MIAIACSIDTSTLNYCPRCLVRRGQPFCLKNSIYPVIHILDVIINYLLFEIIPHGQWLFEVPRDSLDFDYRRGDAASAP